MATQSSIFAWRIPWTEEPGRYSPWGHKESDMTERLTYGKENFGNVIKGTDLEMGIFQVGTVSSHESLKAEELSWLH